MSSFSKWWTNHLVKNCISRGAEVCAYLRNKNSNFWSTKMIKASRLNCYQAFLNALLPSSSVYQKMCFFWKGLYIIRLLLIKKSMTYIVPTRNLIDYMKTVNICALTPFMDNAGCSDDERFLIVYSLNYVCLWLMHSQCPYCTIPVENTHLPIWWPGGVSRCSDWSVLLQNKLQGNTTSGLHKLVRQCRPCAKVYLVQNNQWRARLFSPSPDIKYAFPWKALTVGRSTICTCDGKTRKAKTIAKNPTMICVHL